MGQYSLLDSRDIVAGFFPVFERMVDATWSNALYMNIQSDSETENYKWLGQSPGLRVWEGERHAETLNRFTYALTNLTYEDTLAILLEDLRRDKTGQLRIRIADMARKAADHGDKLAAALLDDNGDSYDGNAFFAVDHDESGTNQINALTATQAPSLNVSTAAAPTADEMSAAIVEMIGHFYTITDDKGDPMNGGHTQFTLVAPTSKIWAGALGAVNRDNLSSGATNAMVSLDKRGINVSVVLEPRLTVQAAATQFNIFATDGATLPLIFQEEVPLTTQLDTSEEFKADRHLFGLKAVRTAGYGFWQKAMRGTLS